MNLCGRTPLGALPRADRTRTAGVVQRHGRVARVAAALGTPSVVVAMRQRHGPLGAARPRASPRPRELSGVPAVHVRHLPVWAECAMAIGVGDVIEQAGELLAEERHVT